MEFISANRAPKKSGSCEIYYCESIKLLGSAELITAFGPVALKIECERENKEKKKRKQNEMNSLDYYYFVTHICRKITSI